MGFPQSHGMSEPGGRSQAARRAGERRHPPDATKHGRDREAGSCSTRMTEPATTRGMAKICDGLGI